MCARDFEQSKSATPQTRNRIGPLENATSLPSLGAAVTIRALQSALSTRLLFVSQVDHVIGRRVCSLQMQRKIR